MYLSTNKYNEFIILMGTNHTENIDVVLQSIPDIEYSPTDHSEQNRFNLIDGFYEFTE